MNRDKSSLPKSRAWWCHHLSAREISQAENKTESLAKLNFLLTLPFGTSKQSPWLFRAHDWKYRESLARQKKLKVLIICQKNPFGEQFWKKKNFQEPIVFEKMRKNEKWRFLPIVIILLCVKYSKNDLLYRVCTKEKFKAIKQKYFCLKVFYLSFYPWYVLNHKRDFEFFTVF